MSSQVRAEAVRDASEHRRPLEARGTEVTGDLLEAISSTVDSSHVAGATNPPMSPVERFLPPVTFDDATFVDQIDFRRYWFTGSSSFAGATFGDITFEQSEFAADASFVGARFRGSVSFAHVRFRLPPWSSNAFVGRGLSTASFEKAVFDGFANFNKAQFISVSFARCDFHSAVSFRGVDFGVAPTFRDAKLSPGAAFVGTKFGDGARFDRAHFGSDAKFADCKFGDYASFEQPPSISVAT